MMSHLWLCQFYTEATEPNVLKLHWLVLFQQQYLFNAFLKKINGSVLQENNILQTHNQHKILTLIIRNIHFNKINKKRKIIMGNH